MGETAKAEYKPPRVPDNQGLKMYAKLERKVCLQCKEEKSLSLFRMRLKQKKYRCFESYCKACEKDNYRTWYIANRDELKIRDYKRNCEKFGLTSAEYEMLVEQQRGLCAICKKPESRTRSGKIKNLAIDHRHKTGQVRALLCCDCNMSLGLLKEDSKIMIAMIAYVEKFKSQG